MPRPEYPAPLGEHTCTREADISILNTAILEIKDTLKGMKELLTANAVLEEQMYVSRKSLKAYEERLRSVELEQARCKGHHKWVDRVVWALVAAALSGAVVYLKV